MPRVTVLMNCLNGEGLVGEAIRSVYAQTYQDWEIVFWDNASVDKTAEIAKSFDNRLRYFRSQDTVPLGQAREWALEQAKGEWVTILDHDDAFLPQNLERQIGAIGTGGYTLSYSGYREVDERDRFLRDVLPRNRSGELLHQLLVDFEINIAAVMMRRAHLRQLETKTIQSFKMAEDYYLYLSLAARGQVCVVPEVLVKYRQVSSSWSEKALDRHAVEFHQTLDQLERDIPGITERYKEGFAHARAHAEYARAKYLMDSGRFAEARKVMRRIQPFRRAYGVLHAVSYIPPLWVLIHKRSVKAKLTHMLIGGRS